MNHDCIGLAATAWLAGVVALLFDHSQFSRPLIIGMRTLFGILTCAAICLALIPKARSLAEAPQAELYLFVRSVSRWVYILMYGLAIVRVSLNLYDAIQLCALCGARSATGSVRPLDDFQFYIACCIVPLWVVRAVVLAVHDAARHLNGTGISASPYCTIRLACPHNHMYRPLSGSGNDGVT